MSEDLASAPEPLDADTLLQYAERIEALPPETAAWVGDLFQECLRARLHEADLLASGQASAEPCTCMADTELAQVALDVAEWLRTLWSVGYMGAGSFPAAPRSAFPVIELEDVLKSALFARIRQGKRPLPFPPPTRDGRPWHDLIEGEPTRHAVVAEIVRGADDQPQGALIEGDNGWQIVANAAEHGAFIIQHRQRGPLFRLETGSRPAMLVRLAPQETQTIHLQERGGFRSFTLEWTAGEPAGTSIPLRAATWERAESEAAHWIATHHPEYYGRIRFTHSASGTNA